MPKILFCDSSEGWGGLQQWMLAAAAGLPRYGWEVSVAGRAGSVLLPRTAAAGIRTHAWPFHWELDLITYMRARGFTREARPDVVVVGSGRDIRSAGLALKQAGSPIIWRIGGRPKFAWFQRLTRDRLVDHALVPSEFSRSLLRSAGWAENEITVIPNGIAPIGPPTPDQYTAARRLLRIDNGSVMVLFVGSLRRVKQVDVLIRAFGKVHARSPSAHLFVVGNGVKDRELRELAEGLNLDGKIAFSGFSIRPDDYFAGCDLFVLPSREETFGWVLLEAMARGKPVVGSRSGAIPEVVGDGESAILVDSGDPDALASAIGVLADDPQLRERLGRAGAERVRTLFTEDLMLSRLDQFFRSFIQ